VNGCEAWLDAQQERLDGPLDAARSQALDAHLAACAGCRERERGLRELRDALRALPVPPLPAAALREVLSRTVEAPRTARPGARRGWSWRLAAAAVIFLAAAVPLSVRLLNRPAHSAAEVARAREDVRLALGIASRALRRSEHIARDEVLVGRVSPAVRRVPIRWPKPGPATERSKT